MIALEVAAKVLYDAFVARQKHVPKLPEWEELPARVRREWQIAIKEAPDGSRTERSE